MKLLDEGLKQLCAVDKTVAYFIEPRFKEISGALQLYILEIERFNTAYRLVKAADRDTLIIKHILDSLAPLGHIARLMGMENAALSPNSLQWPGTLADIGSGAGLPGIPLAICLPAIQVTLIERMGRRAGFLQNTCAVLASAFPGLQFSRVVVEEIELEKAMPAQFDVLVLRALSPLDNTFVAKLTRLLAPNGTIAAYKGKQTTAQAELDSLCQQGNVREQASFARYTTELIPINVPFLNEERCLAIMRQ